MSKQRIDRKQRTQTNKHKGDQFEAAVQAVLELMNYKTTKNHLLNGTQIDLLAEKTAALEKIRLVVECADRDGPIGVPLVKEKAAVLLTLQACPSQYIYRLLYVSNSGFTKEAKAFAATQTHILLMTLEEIENQLIDFSPYANWFIENYEKCSGMFSEAKLCERYVDLEAVHEGSKNPKLLKMLVEDWMNEDDNNLLLILGEFGDGKTSFCRHTTYQWLKQRFRNGLHELHVPILVNLRDNKREFDLPKTLVDTLRGRYGVSVPSFMALENFCMRRRVCLILDGFDEMAETLDWDTLVKCWNQIFLLASLNSKIILTCRTNFFDGQRNVIEMVKRFSAQLVISRAGTSIDTQIDYSNHGRILRILKLSCDKVKEFVAKRFSDPDQFLLDIGRIHDLTDLRSRPVMLEMIMTTLPELLRASTATNVNSASLYATYTDRWSTRDEWRSTVSKEVRQKFCDLTAWSMHLAGLEEVDGADLDTAIRHVFLDAEETQRKLEQLRYDIRVCSFLTISGETDKLRFAHKSFLEFFVARFVVHSILTNKKLVKNEFSDLKQAVDRRTSPPKVNRSHDIRVLISAPSFGNGHEELMQKLRRYYPEALYGLIPQEVLSVVSLSPSDSLSSIFCRNQPFQTAAGFGLSEEIATFAAELFLNEGVSISDILATEVESSTRKVVCDILRLGRCGGFVRRESQELLNYAEVQADPLVKFCLSIAVVRHSDTVSAECVKRIHRIVERREWTYVLFELALRPAGVVERMEDAFQLVEPLPVERVIRIHWSNGTVPETEDKFWDGNALVELLKDEDTDRAISLIDEIKVFNVPDERFFAMLESLYHRVREKAAKEKVIEAISSLGAKSIWMSVRLMAAKESNEALRKLLWKAEEAVRSRSSQSALPGCDYGTDRMQSRFWNRRTNK